jgi:hypothetical protein
VLLVSAAALFVEQADVVQRPEDEGTSQPPQHEQPSMPSRGGHLSMQSDQPVLTSAQDRNKERIRSGGMLPDQLTIRHWLERVQGEYREMPGLSLTESQAQRLWGLDSTACHALFQALLQSGFLRRTNNGAYIRADISA